MELARALAHLAVAHPLVSIQRRKPTNLSVPPLWRLDTAAKSRPRPTSHDNIPYKECQLGFYSKRH